jgi:hypothetical protein
MQATWTQLQEIPMFQVMQRMSKTEERRRTRTMSQRRIHAPTPRSSIAKPHQVEPDKCMWNKKYKGYRFKSICDKLEVAFKPCHKFSAELGRYVSKGNESGDDWRCAGMPDEGENKNDKLIVLPGNGKTKNLLNPKPKPKLHNAFAILSQPNAPANYDAPSPTQPMDDDRIIIPPGPWEPHKQQNIAQRQHIKQTLRQLHESDNLFLNNSITHVKDKCTAIAKGNTKNAKCVAINSSHAQRGQPTIGLAQRGRHTAYRLVSSLNGL